MRLEELGMGCLEVPEHCAGIEVTGLTSDSREVRPGFLFVAVRGEKTDGHLFSKRAEESGAVAVVGEKAARPWKEGARPLRVPYLNVADSRHALGRLAANLYRNAPASLAITGVTGTKGKTTTAWILDSVLRSAGVVDARREGTWVYYRLAPQADAFCKSQLSTLARAFGREQTLRRDVERLLKTRGPNSCA